MGSSSSRHCLLLRAARLAPLLLGLLASCVDSSVIEGCVADGDCPAGQACVARACEVSCDAGTPLQRYPDHDGDGVGAGAVEPGCPSAPGYAAAAGDCDDDDAAVAGPRPWYPDADRDGVGATGSEPVESCSPVEGHSTEQGDCNDLDPTVFPAGDEPCPDGVEALGRCAPGCVASDADIELQGNEGWGSGTVVVADFDGDGHDDVALGSYRPSDGESGAVQIVFGPIRRDKGLAGGVVLTSIGPARSQGGCMAAAGDVDGDGLPDLLVGGWTSTAGTLTGGERVVYLLPGRGLAARKGAQVEEAMAGVATAIYQGYDAQAESGGLCPLAAGDLDGDGAPDPIIGAPFDLDRTNGSQSGAIYVVPGRCLGEEGRPIVVELGPVVSCDVPGQSFEGLTIYGDAEGSNVGADASVGLLDPGSAPDLLFSSPGGSDLGTVHGFLGPRTGTFHADAGELLVRHPPAGFHFTGAVALPDLDGSGEAELAVAWSRDVSEVGTGAGALVVLHDPLLGSELDLARVPPLFSHSRRSAGGWDGFAARLDSPGDLDGDGTPDLAVFNVSGIWVYSGAALLEQQTPLAIEPDGDSGNFGDRPVALGDFDRDGSRDLVVGSTLARTGGMSLIYLGPWQPGGP